MCWCVVGLSFCCFDVLRFWSVVVVCVWLCACLFVLLCVWLSDCLLACLFVRSFVAVLLCCVVGLLSLFFVVLLC